MKRRDFLKTSAALVAAGALLDSCSFTESGASGFNINRLGNASGMKLSFAPYELELRHVFTVASYSRKTTPGVQVKIEWEGYTGYGEASMPPYLGQSVETVTAFLNKVDLSQFKDPFQLAPAVDFADLDGNLLISNDLYKGMEVMDGKITLSDRPGIGLELL